MSKINNQRFYEWLNDIEDFMPVLHYILSKSIINSPCPLNFKSFNNKNAHESGCWYKESNTIKFNAKMPISPMIEDVINLISDINNPNHQLYSYEKFTNGETYAYCKIKAQYQSFIKSSKILYEYLKFYGDEARKLCSSEDEYIAWKRAEKKNITSNFVEYFTRETDINKFFVDDWNNWHNHQIKVSGMTSFADQGEDNETLNNFG